MQVPVYQRQAQQQGLPNVQQNISVDANNFIGGTEQAALKFGETAVANVGNAVNAIYAQQLHEAKQTRLLDATTQLQTHVQDTMFGPNGALQKRGADAFLGSDGKTVSDLTFDDILHKQNTIADTLGDEAQKSEFKRSTNSMLMSMRGQLLGHEAEQHRVYTQSTLESSNVTQGNNITLNYNNPDSIKSSVAQLKANSAQLARINGQDETWGAVHAQSNISTALNKSIETATVNGDHNTALKILHDFSPDMNQNDLLQNYQKITKAQDDISAVAAATTTMNSMAARFAPQAGDRLTNLVFANESGGKQLDGKGQPITSQKGAIGIAQVMPATGPEAAKLAGLEWDEQLFKYNQDYNAALGKAYLQKQIQTNNGDLQKGLAAYNAGPRALQDAIKKADKEGGQWLGYLPPETQKYVTNISAQYESGGGKPPGPTLQEIQQHTLAQLPNATLEQRATALQEVTRQFDVNKNAIKDHEDYNTEQAIIGLEANKGDFMALPQSVRENIPPEKLKSLQQFAADKVKGIPTETDWTLYYNLYKDAPLLTKTNLEALKPQLADAEFKQLTARKVELQNGADSTKTRNAKEVLDGYMREVGIDPTPKDSDKAGAVKVGKIWSVFEQNLGDLEQSSGKKASPDEIKMLAKQLFTTVGVKGLLYGTNEKMAVFLEPKDQLAVPAADRKQIIAGLKLKRPGLAITEQDITDLYIKHKGLN